MEAQNYFDKFMEDLELREQKKLQQQKDLSSSYDMWLKRQELNRKYQEHAQQRVRYKK